MKKTEIKDPFYNREVEKYENPIPSREYIIELLTEKGKPLTREQLASALKLTDEARLEGLRRRLNAMLRDGQLIRNRKNGYCLINKADLIIGRVLGHKDGFGFLQPEDGSNDLFLPPREMRILLPGDKAIMRVADIDRRNRRIGSLVEVVERGIKTVVGRLHIEGGVGFVEPDNQRIQQEVIVPLEALNGAKDKQMVSVELTQYPTRRTRAIGRINEVLGDHMAPGMEIDLAIRSHDIPLEWPDEVLESIKHLTVNVADKDKEGRADLRELPLVTIDGADARDFDDAVYCKKTPKGWRLLVCIADVSHYVQPNSPLDKEAYKRGTSVYFPDRVIPMLPEVLSNGLCSLNPDVDRLCMCCEMQINEKGQVYRSRFYEAVMNSHARLTYQKMFDIVVNKEAELLAQYKPLLPDLKELYQLYKVMNKARKKTGAIDFGTTETRIVFDQDKKVKEIIPVYRNAAHMLIEECMLAANVTSAKNFLRKKLPALYRIHEGPKAEKIEDLHKFLAELTLKMDGGDKPTAKDYGKLLNEIKDRPDAHLIQIVLLRSMKQAVYSPDNIGHFGLSFEAYTHYTSPIRRYPDLIVHRLIKHLINGGNKNNSPVDYTKLALIGEHCSSTERRADEATRDAVSWLKCEYMLDKVGLEFDGIISGVTAFGIFVELKDIYVDGLVHVTALNHDYFHYEPAGHRLSGERTGIVYRLGDSIRIKVASVVLDDRKIDFVLPDNQHQPLKPKAKKKKYKGKKNKY